jgi:protein involved in polysaccharide export with SLBB domain
MNKLTLTIRSLSCLALSALSVSVAQAQSDPTDVFSVLQSAPLSTDLPLGQSESVTTLPNGLRPNLGYPTLSVDAREPRQPQAASPAAPTPTPSTIDASPFQILVEQTVGMALPVIGIDLFAENARGFEPIEPTTVPADFLLGPGDEVYIRAWGTVDIDYRATIDRGGKISIPMVGEVQLEGVRFADLRDHIQSAITRSYHGFELSVSLGQLRSIRIYVTGFAAAPGTYTVNALTSLVNALFYAGGPGTAGDLRRIELRRAGELVTTLDFYDFLLSGSHDTAIRLLPEDVIHVPALSGEVAIAGAVNRSGIYQLGSGETLADLIDWAGGLNATASTHRSVIERLDEDGNRIVDEIALEEDALKRPLVSGDLVLVQPISPQFRNAVTLRGHVAQPLRHEWHPGMRVSDLLPSVDALVAPSYWISANEEQQLVEILEDGLQTSVDNAFPDLYWEYALIERIDRKLLRTHLIPFDLGRAVKERDPAHDIVLEPGDEITVFSLDDFRTRTGERSRFIRIEGEVGRSGVYEVAAGTTLTEVIELAGGATEDAYIFGTELVRESLRAVQRRRMDEAIDQLEQDYHRHLIDRSRNVLSGDLSLAIPPEASAIRNLISQLRSAEPSGRLILDLDPDVQLLEGLPDIILDTDDKIYVPPRPSTVEVVGAVYRQGSFLYTDESVRRYLDDAGLLETADDKRIYMVRPDGSFEQVGRRVEVRPGDTIIVPEETDRQRVVRRIKDWTQILYQFGLGAAGLNLLLDND